MKPITSYSLETYVERHRADFDLHEPRPELWAALEAQLQGEASSTERPIMGVLPPTTSAISETPTLPAQPKYFDARWQRYGLAAALAILLLAAGVGEKWKAIHKPAQMATMQSPATIEVADAALYVGPTTANVLTANQNSDARLDTAVHGMERYYIAQLNDRKTQLGQLAPTATAEWAREIIGLDSSYQQLKRELPQHPQPEVVLTAMNRNLQIRLDILDQQIERHGGDHTAVAASTSSEYVLADSRVLAENIVRRHAH